MPHPDAELVALTHRFMAGMAASIVASVREHQADDPKAMDYADALQPLIGWKPSDPAPPARSQQAIIRVCEQMAEQGIAIAAVVLLTQAHGPAFIAAQHHVQANGYREGEIMTGVVAGLGASASIARAIRREGGSPITHVVDGPDDQDGMAYTDEVSMN
jgi:hypothetical protein